MIIECDSANVRARVWRGEVPRYAGLGKVVKLYTRCFPSDTEAIESLKWGLEVYRTYGPKLYYGLLCAEYIPSTSANLEVCIASSSEPVDDPHLSLAPGFANLLGGIPPHAVEPIFGTVSEFFTSLPPPSGILKIERGLYAYPGSSGDLYSRLTHCLLLVLFCPQEELETNLCVRIDEQFE